MEIYINQKNSYQFRNDCAQFRQFVSLFLFENEKKRKSDIFLCSLVLAREES